MTLRRGKTNFLFCVYANSTLPVAVSQIKEREINYGCRSGLDAGSAECSH